MQLECLVVLKCTSEIRVYLEGNIFAVHPTRTFVPKKLTGMVVIGVGVAVSSYTTLSFQELLPIAPLVFEST